MNADPNSLQTIGSRLEDHGAEGITILAGSPARLINWIIYSLCGILLLAFVWSFIGRSDVLVTVEGRLIPESKVRRVYAPIDGELVDIYVTEGMSVAQGDLLARIHARGAIEAIAKAASAKIKLTAMEQSQRLFEIRREGIATQLANLKEQLALKREEYDKLLANALADLAQAQKIRLAKTRNSLKEARMARDSAREEYAKYKRLYDTAPAHGGISLKQLESKQSQFNTADLRYRDAQGSLSDLEQQFASEHSKTSGQLRAKALELKDLEVRYESEVTKIEAEEGQLRLQLQNARLEADAADRIKFDNIDQDHFLRIEAPVSGLITEVPLGQPGDKIRAVTPLVGIASENDRPVLHVEIDERNRGLLREGLEVKLKFNAFPYQRYGFKDGKLVLISPNTRRSTVAQKLVYTGRVQMAEEDDYYFMVDGEKRPLHYGMTAKAEVVVQKRRLIDIALDPFRKLSK